jgi:ribosomal protein S18 acetylase RimI-like enzyme
VYEKDDLFVGFARVITDYTIFAYLLDLFILEGYRGQGLGKSLVDHIVNDEAFKNVRWRLDTKDAHGLYRKFGFREPAFPEKIMEKCKVANQSLNSDG